MPTDRTLRTTCFAAAVMLAIGACPAFAQSSFPDPRITSGATNPDVTQETIDSTICVRGWTRTVRPPESYTLALKRRQIREYGYRDQRLRSYEEDHLIPLGVGGSPTDPRNLWPEPRIAPDGWTAEMKDELEAVLSRLVCQRRVPLAVAQAAFASDWEAAYRLYIQGEGE